MMRLIHFFAVLTALLLTAGCANSPYTPDARGLSFSYTQDAVCGNLIEEESYVFFEYASDSGIVVPGLGQNFVPQGIGYWEARNWLILSGYFKPLSGSSAAVLLAVDKATGELSGEYTLVDERGKEYGGHFAGIAVTKTDVFVTGEYSLYRVPLMEFVRAGQKGAVRVAQVIPVSVEAGACNYSDGILWVCEHYQKDDYPLKGRHVMTTNDGTEYHAWMVGYRVTNLGTLKPYCVFSVPDRIQGITVAEDGTVVLSQSYGRTNPSQVLICKDPRRNTPDAHVVVDGYQVPLWYLDQANGMETLSTPPMSEGCCAAGDSVYLIFESGAYFYRAFEPDHVAVDPTDKIWKIDLTENAESTAQSGA